MSLFRKRPATEADRTQDVLDDLVALTDAQLERLVVPRLVLAHELPEEMQETSPLFVRGLYALIAVKLRLGKTVVPSGEIWAVRGGFQRWWPIALGNLSRLFDDPDTEYRRVPTGGLVLSSFMGLSQDLASLVLRFGDLMTHLAVAEHGFGYLVAVPQRQQILWHAIEGNETPEFVHSLATLAAGICRDAPPEVRLSPLVYWVRDDRWDAVTALRDDKLGFVPPDELLAILNQSG